MNQNTWISWITTGIGLVGAFAADRGLIDSSTATTVAGAAATLVPLAWGLFIHRDSKVVATASVVPGVETIKVDTRAAAPAVAALANDTSIATVQPIVTSSSPNPYQTSQKGGF